MLCYLARCITSKLSSTSSYLTGALLSGLKDPWKVKNPFCASDYNNKPNGEACLKET